jgi:hypothetical protein
MSEIFRSSKPDGGEKWSSHSFSFMIYDYLKYQFW